MERAPEVLTHEAVFRRLGDEGAFFDLQDTWEAWITFERLSLMSYATL